MQTSTINVFNMSCPVFPVYVFTHQQLQKERCRLDLSCMLSGTIVPKWKQANKMGAKFWTLYKLMNSLVNSDFLLWTKHETNQLGPIVFKPPSTKIISFGYVFRVTTITYIAICVLDN